METNKTIAIVGENNLPEIIEDKLGQNKTIVPNRLHLANQLKDAATIITKTAQTAENIFPKNIF